MFCPPVIEEDGFSFALLVDLRISFCDRYGPEVHRRHDYLVVEGVCLSDQAHQVSAALWIRLKVAHGHWSSSAERHLRYRLGCRAYSDPTEYAF